MFTAKIMRERFAELQDQRAAIVTVSGPLREARDKFVQENHAKEREMNAEIHAAEAGLFEIDQEIAALARALRGKTSTPDE